MAGFPWLLRRPAVALAALVALIPACNTILGIDDVRRCGVALDLSLVQAAPSSSVLDHHATGGGASLVFLLNSDPEPDALVLDLYDGMGGHGVVNAVGSYALSAADTTLGTCGICVGIYSDYDAGAKMFSQSYLARTQGTLKLDMFDATGIAGSLRGLELREVMLSNDGVRDVPGGCTVAVGDAEFSARWSTTAAAAGTIRRAIAPPH